MPATARYQGHGTNQLFLLRFVDSHDINLDTQNLEALREWLALRQIPEPNFSILNCKLFDFSFPSLSFQFYTSKTPTINHIS